LKKLKDNRKIILGWDKDGNPYYDWKETAFYKHYYPKMQALIPDGTKLLKEIKKEKE